MRTVKKSFVTRKFECDTVDVFHNQTIVTANAFIKPKQSPLKAPSTYNSICASSFQSIVSHAHSAHIYLQVVLLLITRDESTLLQDLSFRSKIILR